MSTLKDVRTKIGFWFYKNSHGLMFVSFFFMAFSLIYALIFTTKNKPEHYTGFDLSVFLYFIPFFIMGGLFLFFATYINRKKWQRSSNYLIVIDLAEKLNARLKKDATITSDIFASLYDLKAKAKKEKDSKKLVAWMVNYRTYEKYQKFLEEKRKRLEEIQKLPLEILETEKNVRILYNDLTW